MQDYDPFSEQPAPHVEMEKASVDGDRNKVQVAERQRGRKEKTFAKAVWNHTI